MSIDIKQELLRHPAAYPRTAPLNTNQTQSSSSELEGLTEDGVRLPASIALESGLPTLADVQATLLKIAAPKHLGSAEAGGVATPYFSFEAGEPENFTASQHAEFVREFSTDVAELKLRINRLKLRVAKIALRGSAYRESSFRRDEVNDPLEIRSSQAWQAYAKGFESDEHRSQFVADYNSIVPSLYRTESSHLLSSHDAGLIYEVYSSMRHDKEGPSKDETAAIRPVFARLVEIGQQLRDIEEAPLLFSLSDEKDDHQGALRESWRRYRELARELAALEEHGNWCCPSYGESLKPQRGLAQHSEPFKTDYQRYQNTVVWSVERKAHRVFFRDTISKENASSMLFPNGLAAMEAVFLLIAEDLNRKPRGRTPQDKLTVLSASDLYVEVGASIFAFCQRTNLNQQKIPSYDTDALIGAIKKELPCAVFLEPLANSYGMRVTEVSRVLEALSDHDWENEASDAYRADERLMYLVIDSTTLGPQALWKQCKLDKLPHFVRVVNIESLIKYGEDGQDLTSAAVVTISGQSANFDLEYIRSRRGFMPSEQMARRIDFSVDRDAIERRLARHSRNTGLISRRLDDHAAKTVGFIDRPQHPLLAEHPDYEALARESSGFGGLVSVGLRYSLLNDYRELQGVSPHTWDDRPMDRTGKERIAKAYSILVTLLAGEVGLDLVLGTSFGFNTTRLAVYERQRNDNEQPLANGYQSIPYVRIAPGVETVKDAVLTAAVLKRADEIFSTAIRARQVGQLSELLVKGGARLTSGRDASH